MYIKGSISHLNYLHLPLHGADKKEERTKKKAKQTNKQR